MADANGNILMSVAEIELLRCVFEATCAEHHIPREGSCAEHLARFLMLEFSLSTSTESSLLAAVDEVYRRSAPTHAER